MKGDAHAGLCVTSLRVTYGGVVALDDVHLHVACGSVVGLIGPNGAGKTTLINAVTGVVRPSAGTITLGERRLERLPQHRVARAGIARTYQNIRLFGRLSVAQNLQAGAYAGRNAYSDDGLLALMARTGMAERDLARRAGTLPYGEQRRLEIARALAAKPRVMLLDEPAAGMNPLETQQLRAVIAGMAADGIGVMLVEHDMSLVGAACDRVVVLNFGKNIAAGSPRDVARDPAVIEAYLGA